MVDEDDGRHWARTREVLTSPVDAFDLAADAPLVAKMQSFVLRKGGSDLWFRPGRFELRFAGEAALHSYLPALAAWTLLDLRLRLGGDAITEARVGPTTAPGAVPLDAFGERFTDGRSMVWVLPRADDVVVFIRPAPPDVPNELHPIHEDGDWPLPVALPPWRERSTRTKSLWLPDPLDCIRCDASRRDWKQLAGGKLVCRSCGGSQPRY